MSNDHETLADRLNAEPAIFKGCSSSELGMIVGLAIVVWLPLSLLLAWLLGAITMGFGIAGVGVVATVVVMATLFQRIKRGRPEGYYQQWLRIRLQTMGLYRTPWVLRSGSWDIGRTHYAPLPTRNR
jgi:conjugative transfer region protein (TIGR03750 family)